MRFTRTHPCDTCPFRRDVPGFLHPERAREIAERLLLADEMFTCHKTLRYSNDEEGEETIPHAGEQACAGAMLFCLGQRRLPQLARIALRLGLFDPDTLRGTSLVFQTATAFVRHMENAEDRAAPPPNDSRVE